jgi:signal transduction histidine kinase/ActR/RegA family two-component response regulator
MTESDVKAHERRVLVLGPNGKDAELIRTVLGDAGMECCYFSGSNQLAKELKTGAGALIVTEEALMNGVERMLVDFMRMQPQWSELPVLIVTTRESSSPTIVRFMESLGNVTLIERPMRVAVLISAVRAALRARQRQYQIRAYIAERERIEESLREAGRRKDEFLAALAHELRNPLAPISNTLHLLRSSDSPSVDTQWAHGMIERQVQHLTRLVDDLLDVSRITRGKVTLRREVVELETIIRNAIETSKPLLEAASHKLHVSLPQTPVKLHADPVRLAQALSNLLNNAAKYTPNHGQIHLSAVRENGTAVIRVKDNGIGIAEPVLSRVFELFMQADNSVARSQGGLGIGLTLVRTFIELHGGTIEASSKGSGRGSEFVIRLPVLEVTAQPTDVAAQNGNGATHHARRILVVDDNHDGAESLALLLQMQGNEVHTVYDGPEAVEAMSQFHPDVVLLDIGLPTLNGYETARRMRALPDSCDALIIALTGWGQEEDRRRSREAGFDHHLVKPVDLQTLESLLAGNPSHGSNSLH